jgi:hypothetical protein
MSCRNLCAIDWLKRNPGGKTGEFNKYWDHEIDQKDKAVLMEWHVDLASKANQIEEKAQLL